MKARAHALMALASRHDHQREIDALRKCLILLLVQEECNRILKSQHYLTASCLGVPHLSAWAVLYQNGTDVNFLDVTGLSRDAFEHLLLRFALFYKIRMPQRNGGRPPKLIQHHYVLGLLLHYYVGTMGQNTLCQVFAVPPKTLNRVLNAAESAMYEALKGYYPARISWPSPSRQVELASWVEAKELLVKFSWGFIDGKNYKVVQPSDADRQNAMYNGWLHCVLVTGTLCFAADGTIVWAKHNCPGSWNDSDTSLEFRYKLLDPKLCPDPRYGVVSDSAFPCSNDMTGRILTPMKDGDIDKLLPSVRSAAMALHNAITSIRQAAEWGVGSIEKVFGRLRLPLPYNQEKRHIRLSNLFHLANFRVRTVGISQIRNTFNVTQTS